MARVLKTTLFYRRAGRLVARRPDPDIECPGCREVFETAKQLSAHCKESSSTLCQTFRFRTIRDLKKTCSQAIGMKRSSEQIGGEEEEEFGASRKRHKLSQSQSLANEARQEAHDHMRSGDAAMGYVAEGETPCETVRQYRPEEEDEQTERNTFTLTVRPKKPEEGAASNAKSENQANDALDDDVDAYSSDKMGDMTESSSSARGDSPSAFPYLSSDESDGGVDLNTDEGNDGSDTSDISSSDTIVPSPQSASLDISDDARDGGSDDEDEKQDADDNASDREISPSSASHSSDDSDGGIDLGHRAKSPPYQHLQRSRDRLRQSGRLQKDGRIVSDPGEPIERQPEWEFDEWKRPHAKFKVNAVLRQRTLIMQAADLHKDEWKEIREQWIAKHAAQGEGQEQ